MPSSSRVAPDALVGVLRALGRSAHGAYTALGLLLVGGIAAAIAGVWAFAVLAGEVLEGETQRFDDATLRWLDGFHAPWLDNVMLEITALGNGTVVLVLAIVAGTLLWLTRQRSAALLLAAATVGAMVLSLFLKSIFDRPRPQVVTWGTHVVTSSFPSGHAISAIVVYATVAYLVARLQRRRAARVATLLLALVVICLIAASRLFLGVHYPSDVAAGLAIGLAWAGFCMAMLEALQRLRGRDTADEARHDEPASAGGPPPPPSD